MPDAAKVVSYRLSIFDYTANVSIKNDNSKFFFGGGSFGTQSSTWVRGAGGTARKSPGGMPGENKKRICRTNKKIQKPFADAHHLKLAGVFRQSVP
jgi:hypothetical protein